jgi:hypothetical protein
VSCEAIEQTRIKCWWVLPFMRQKFSWTSPPTGFFDAFADATGVERQNLRKSGLAVKDYSRKLLLRAIAPHDLRRSCAKFCHAAGGKLDQIQFLLGNVSVQTQKIPWLQAAPTRRCERPHWNRRPERLDNTHSHRSRQATPLSPDPYQPDHDRFT